MGTSISCSINRYSTGTFLNYFPLEVEAQQAPTSSGSDDDDDDDANDYDDKDDDDEDALVLRPLSH